MKVRLLTVLWSIHLTTTLEDQSQLQCAESQPPTARLVGVCRSSETRISLKAKVALNLNTGTFNTKTILLLHILRFCQNRSFSGNGWCFLEYVKNPSNPSEDCYPDAQWSEMHSRFWSSEACEPQLIAVPEPMNGPPAPPPPGTKLIFPSGKNGK
jgi:hypothetical protein